MEKTEYIVIKALSSNVQVIGFTRGNETKPLHTEMLDSGEVLIVQFTDNTSVMKIRGNAEITTQYGTVRSEKKQEDKNEKNSGTDKRRRCAGNECLHKGSSKNGNIQQP